MEDAVQDGRSRKRLHAVVQGRVQGVGFRYFVLDRAQDLGIVGFCRNLWNGDVEVVAEGAEAALQVFLADLHQGPRMSRVDRVHASWHPAAGGYTTFSISPTR